jgi:hypothetical protein
MASTNILDYTPKFQFGQAGVPWALQKVACTDTCVQMIINYYKDRYISLNEVRKDSGVAPYGTGLTVTQALKSLSANGVTHYRWTLGYDRVFMLGRLKLGPVIVSTYYKYYPIWDGKKCTGTNKAQIGGKTDCYFTGAHAVLVIKAIPVYSDGKLLRYDYLVRDPDHNSPGRPEKPKYDRMTETQLKRAMEYIKYLPVWEKPSVMYPTQRKIL